MRWSARHYLVRRAPLTRVVVVGGSMRPTLEPGDRLLVRRRARVAAGDVVAVADPRLPARVMVKRVASTAADGLWVVGDNPTASTDSRSLGWVPPAAVEGRVVYRYAPGHRRGRLVPLPPGGGGTLGAMWADEVEQVTSADYLGDLAARPLGEIRAMRDECQRVEDKVSYLRRLVQGRLDILTAELKRRAEGGAALDLSSLVEQLPEILSDKVHAPGPGRLPSGVGVPDDADLTAELDAAAGPLDNLPELSDAAVQDRVDAVAELERRVSAARRALFGSIDALHDELVRRFRNGEGGPIPDDE